MKILISVTHIKSSLRVVRCPVIKCLRLLSLVKVGIKLKLGRRCEVLDGWPKIASLTRNQVTDLKGDLGPSFHPLSLWRAFATVKASVLRLVLWAGLGPPVAPDF